MGGSDQIAFYCGVQFAETNGAMLEDFCSTREGLIVEVEIYFTPVKVLGVDSLSSER